MVRIISYIMFHFVYNFCVNFVEETELKGYWYFLSERKISNLSLQFCDSEFNSENKALLVMQWRTQNLCTFLSTLSIPNTVERLWEQHHFTQNSSITHKVRRCLTSLTPTNKAFLKFLKDSFLHIQFNQNIILSSFLTLSLSIFACW